MYRLINRKPELTAAVKSVNFKVSVDVCNSALGIY